MSEIFNSYRTAFTAFTEESRTAFEKKMAGKTKPLGSLGLLEDLAIQMALIQDTGEVLVKKPCILVFAADHGIAGAGVSAYPQEVTHQMVLNFTGGGAAISVLCKEHNLELEIIDAGVNHVFESSLPITGRKAGMGTRDFQHADAMTESELEYCLSSGRDIAAAALARGSNVLGFGEMGIANTSSASLIIHFLSGISLDLLVGAGTGLSSAAQNRKFEILEGARQNFLQAQPLEDSESPAYLLSISRRFGGFEIIMMAAAMLETARGNALVLVDGFISTAAWMIAWRINPSIKQFTVFSHASAEKGHRAVLDYLGARALLDLKMRLGEGSGAALAIPILRSAAVIMHSMASFESAGVSTRSDLHA